MPGRAPTKPYSVSRVPILGGKGSRLGRERLAARGLPTKVPVGPVREHVVELKKLGMGNLMIAQRAGVSSSLIRRIYSEPEKYPNVLIHRAHLIMQADHMPIPEMTMVLGCGANRRLQALCAMGWRHKDLGKMLGTDLVCYSLYARTVRYRSWTKICAVYDQYAMLEGPSEVSRVEARKRGWMTCLAWEGVDIDHPHSKPLNPSRSRGTS